MAQSILPFKVGETLEVRSFEEGYRGAWFRCEILNIYTKEGKLFYSLKYLDYDGEEIHHTQVYQRFEDEEKEWLMVRPSYPPHCHERQVRKIKADQEPLVVVHGPWKVGDLVDWERDGCFWCAMVLAVKRNDLQIELFPPPHGEGQTYLALRKDVRPSLDWSPEDGWTLPSVDGRKSQSVQLVKREKEVDHVPLDVCQTGKEETERAKKQRTEGDTQQLKGSGEIRLNIDESDSIEAAVYDLEELIVRIEWIKKMLSPDVGEGSTWKYQDYRPSSKGM